MNRKKVRILRELDNVAQQEELWDYIHSHPEWVLDEKNEYVIDYDLEGSDLLDVVAKDAKNEEYDILVTYSQKIISHKVVEVSAFILLLNDIGVDIYTVEEDCITKGAILIFPR